MGENSKIEWTHHTYLRLAVSRLVTLLAKCDAVRGVEAEFGELCERLDVVGVQVAAARIATFLAGEVITAEHIETPSLVREGESQTPTLRRFAVFVSRTSCAAWGAFPGNDANLAPRFDSVLDALALGWLSVFGNRHHALCFVGVTLSLESGYATTQGSVGIVSSTARLADGRQTVTAAIVSMESVALDPLAAGVTPLVTLLDALLVFLHGYADTLRRYFDCTDFATHVHLS